MKTIIFMILSLQLAATAQTVPANITDKHSKTPTGFLMVLNQGDSLMPYLETLMIRENIPSATVTGIGFVNAVFGFYNRQTKEYDPKTFDDVELASMSGSAAWQNGKPSLHLHGVVTDRNFQAFGGHLLAAIVGTGSLEITITVHSKKLERKVDESIGANVLQIK
ncbi:MAG: DNA-binding protein [Niastella sp.]|nr:DNA-binding protein [Niastella sp.]